MAKKEKGSKKDEPVVISFKLASELFDQLVKYSESQTDEAGMLLSPSQAARRLMLESLKRHTQKKS